MEDFPRVLIIAPEPFNRMTSSSYLLTNLFSGWPREKLAQVYTSSVAPDFSLCQNYWKFDPLSVLSRGGPVVQSNGSLNKRIRTRRRMPFLDPRTKRTLAYPVDLVPYPISDDFRNWIKAFNPDLIYSWLGNNRVMGLIAAICREHNLAVVPHFMDDWLGTGTGLPVFH